MNWKQLNKPLLLIPNNFTYSYTIYISTITPPAICWSTISSFTYHADTVDTILLYPLSCADKLLLHLLSTADTPLLPLIQILKWRHMCHMWHFSGSQKQRKWKKILANLAQCGTSPHVIEDLPSITIFPIYTVAL